MTPTSLATRPARLLTAAASGLALAASAGAGPIDLDLLIGGGSVPPNVVLVFDNSGSMRTLVAGDPESRDRLQVAADVLTDLIESVNPDDPLGGVQERARFGLATFVGKNPAYADDHCAGATLRVPIASGNKGALIAEIDSIPQEVRDGGNASGTCLSETLVDVARYFAANHSFGSYPTDLSADPRAIVAIDEETGSVSNIEVEPICAGPCPTPIDQACRQSFAVIVTDGEAQRDSNNHYGTAVANTTAGSTFLSAVGNADGDANECPEVAPDHTPATCYDDPKSGRDDGITYNPDKDGTDWLDDVAQVMHDTDFHPDLDGVQNVTTYTVGFAVDHALLLDTAQNGGGLYRTAASAVDLETALTTTLLDVLYTAGSFSSPTVPSARGSTGSVFYNAYFEPGAQAFWPGFLEAYRMTPAGEIVDQNGDPALAADGSLRATRVPYWEAGDVLASNASRSLYTTKAGARENFDEAQLSTGDLAILAGDPLTYPNYPASGVDTTGELRDAIVRYVHGQDAFDEDGDSDATELRDAVLGDIFHSTPLVIEAPQRFLLPEPGYAGFRSLYAARDRVIYTGANDGMLHAFDAGSRHSGDDPGTVETEDGYYDPGTGSERFGYVPGLLLPTIKEIPRNRPRLHYYVDGSPVAADAWLGDGSGSDVTKSVEEWATVLLTGFREGGAGYLALDVTDPDAGSGDPHGPYPRLLWEFSHAKLASSWSTPVIARVKLEGASGSGDHCGHSDGDGNCREQWVAIFAGGYQADGDPNHGSYVSNPASAAWSDRGKALFMVRLDDGEVLASVEFDASGATGPADMKFAIPSAPAAIDLDFDGFVDVVYVGDLGGQLWKWDLSALGTDADADGRVDTWPAELFFRTNPVAGNYRSFFYPPSAAFVDGTLTLAFGSGERENLSDVGSPGAGDNDRFYVVADPHPTGALAFPAVKTESDLTNVTAIDTDNDPSDFGFYFVGEEGEKFVTQPTIFTGYVVVGSYRPQPSADPCASGGGQAFLYVFDVATGRGYFDDSTTTGNEGRRVALGSSLPSDPRVSVGEHPDDDVIFVKTADGRIITIDPPPRPEGSAGFIYWRQVY